MSEITVCLIIAVVTMILFIGRVFPMALTSVLCALAMGICLPSVKLSAMAIATPIGTPVNMQILPAGYKFSDYVKIGGPLWLIFVIAVCLTAKGILF